MSFEVTDHNDGDRQGGVFITIDKQRRLCLSSRLRKELSVDKLSSFYAYTAFDHENKRIAIVKQELAKKITNKAPAKFDKRGYTSASPILKQSGISDRELPIRFEYDGDYHDGEYNCKWLTFKRIAKQYTKNTAEDKAEE